MTGFTAFCLVVGFLFAAWAAFCVKLGYVPLRWFPEVRRAEVPVAFWFPVGMYLLLGLSFAVVGLFGD